MRAFAPLRPLPPLRSAVRPPSRGEPLRFRNFRVRLLMYAIAPRGNSPTYLRRYTYLRSKPGEAMAEHQPRWHRCATTHVFLAYMLAGSGGQSR